MEIFATILSLIILFVFFFMADNISKIRKLLEAQVKNQEPAVEEEDEKESV